MTGSLHHTHIRKRLKIIHLFGIGTILCFFALFFFLGETTKINTEATQYILIFMAIITAMSYLILLLHTSDKVPKGPALLFVLLNILNSGLVWSTGILESPFVIFYAILIIISTELYHYRLGLLQVLISLLGFVTVYGATSNYIIPYSNILLYSDISVLYQPPVIILVYGSLYTILFIFAVFSSSSARTVLFRAHEKNEIDTTYQEKIIQELPIGIMIVDWELNVLSTNPSADINFPIKNLGSKITEHLSIMRANPKAELMRMSKTCEDKQLMWKKEDEELIPIKVSARLMPGEKKEDNTFILFLDRLTH